MINKNSLRIKRSERNRNKIRLNSKSNFRLSVFRSNKHIYAQIIDEENQKTLFCASSLDKKLALKKGSDKNAAFKVGEFIAEKAKKDGFENKVSFDRGGYIFHGRIKEVAEGARSKGLKF
tara:strand:- start:7 stop:366 length:360 start_codon:yes stop_codon:yes gene_type:complete